MCYLGPVLLPLRTRLCYEEQKWTPCPSICLFCCSQRACGMTDSQGWAGLELCSGITLAGPLPRWFHSMDFRHYNVINDETMTRGILTVTQHRGKDLLALGVVIFTPCIWKTVLMDFFGVENKQWLWAKHTVYSQDSISLAWWSDLVWNPDEDRSW